MSVAPIRQLKRKRNGIIKYYDGATLLGSANVPVGLDVLHPSITMPSKTGYTFVGWATSNSEDDWVGTLASDGQPLNLYAIYLANTLTVVSGGSILDVNYVSGTLTATAEAYYNTANTSKSFTLLKKSRYNTASCEVKATMGNGSTGAGMNVGNAKIDNTYVLQNGHINDTATKTVTIGAVQHTLYTDAISYGSYFQSNNVQVKSIILSDPIAWT